MVLPEVWSHSAHDTAGTGAVGRSGCVGPGCWWPARTGSAERQAQASRSFTTNQCLVTVELASLNLWCKRARDNKLRTTSRALCMIKLLPVTHVLVDTWMLTVKPVYKLLNAFDDLKWTTNTHVTTCDSISLIFKAQLTISMVLEDLLFYFNCFAPSFLYPSTHISTCPYSFLPITSAWHKCSDKDWLV